MLAPVQALMADQLWLLVGLVGPPVYYQEQRSQDRQDPVEQMGDRYLLQSLLEWTVGRGVYAQR